MFFEFGKNASSLVIEADTLKEAAAKLPTPQERYSLSITHADPLTTVLKGNRRIKVESTLKEE